MRQPRGNRLFKGSRRRRVGSKHRFKPRQRYRKFQEANQELPTAKNLNVQVDLTMSSRMKWGWLHQMRQTERLV